MITPPMAEPHTLEEAPLIISIFSTMSSGIWERSAIPPVVVADRLPSSRKRLLRETLLTMHADPDGRRILAAGLLARFVAARDADYDPVREMVPRAVAAGFLVLR